MAGLGIISLLLFSSGIAATSSRIETIPSTMAEDCTAESRELHNMTTYQIQISYSNSSHEDNSVVFQLYNPAIGVDAQCAAYGPTLGVGDSRSDTWYPCFVESRDPRISAAFKYDFVANQVTVNETWVCDAADPDQSYV